ncbi:MAG: HipA domain-containing protein [Ignavibacteriales bacterium]|nr:HipA domain-containing protein [Ignavibacteriales bacterium]
MIQKLKCLYCYEPIINGTGEFHPKCVKRFFKLKVPPEVNFGIREVGKLALIVLDKSISVTGVQPKVSLDVETDSKNKNQKRLTVVGLWGKYILKPPYERFPMMPEIEDLTMHLAELVGINTASHSLIRLKSGELSYISQRFDRIENGKLPLEDMAQLTGVLTDRKYKGSMEKVGKAIERYSTYSGNDLLRFFEITLFSFITGNADMHLKNFSLLTNKEGEVQFSPAYDLLATKLLLPEDQEEMALTLNGKKNKLKKEDFDQFAFTLNINKVALNNLYKKFNRSVPNLLDFIDKSFLTDEYREKYKNLIIERMQRLERV